MSTETSESDGDDEICMLPVKAAGNPNGPLTGMSDAHATGDTVQNLQDRDHSDREVGVLVTPSL